MLRFLVTRIGQGLLTLLVLATLVFIFARLLGNPVDVLLPAESKPVERQYMLERLGLDRPYYEQYLGFLGGLLHGDVGTSINKNRPVAELFFTYFSNTVSLTLAAMAIAVVVGATLGIVAALYKGTVLDHGLMVFSVVGMSAPSFWVALLLVLVFAVKLGLLPVARMGGIDSYILPALTLSLPALAGISRLVRSSMLETMGSEYVKFAKIIGVPQSLVIWKHCLRNALLPVLTFAGANLAFMLNGSVVIEAVFAWPGVGRLIYQGIVGRDYPMVQGCLLITGFIIIAINLLVDVLYSVVDPRIRLAK
jgi:peptide/nickel transport system permease protein